MNDDAVNADLEFELYASKDAKTPLPHDALLSEHMGTMENPLILMVRPKVVRWAVIQLLNVLVVVVALVKLSEENVTRQRFQLAVLTLLGTAVFPILSWYWQTAPKEDTKLNLMRWKYVIKKFGGFNVSLVGVIVVYIAGWIAFTCGDKC